MKIKEVIKSSSNKLKSVLSRFKAFLTAKRFNLLSLLLVLFLTSTIGSCRAREPTTANAQSVYADTLTSTYTFICPLSKSLTDFKIKNFSITPIFVEWGENDFGVVSVPIRLYRYANSSNNMMLVDDAFTLTADGYFVSAPIPFLESDVGYMGAWYFFADCEILVSFPSLSPVNFYEVQNYCLINFDKLAGGGCRFVYSYYDINDKLLYQISVKTLSLVWGSSTEADYNEIRCSAVKLYPSLTPKLNEVYQSGYFQGVQDTIAKDSADKTVLGTIMSGVDRFMNIEIFPNVRLSFLLYLGFGMILFSFLIKIFLGG